MNRRPSPPLELLVPDLPAPAALLPWLQRMETSATYTNFGPLCQELEARLEELEKKGKILEAERLRRRTKQDIEMMRRMGARNLPKEEGVV